MPDVTRYELGRPHPDEPPIPSHEHSLNEVAALIKKLPGLGRLAAITEMHQGDDRVVIAIPQVHEAQLVDSYRRSDAGEIKARADKIQGDIKKIKHALGRAGFTQQAREGVGLSARYAKRQEVAVFGAEERESHENAALFAHFSGFIYRSLLRPGFQAELGLAIMHGTKPSEFILKEFQKSEDLRHFAGLVDKRSVANLPSILAFLEAQLQEIFDARFTGISSYNPETAMKVMDALKDSFAIHTVGKRNVKIAETLVKVFASNARAPVVLELGAGHFMADDTGKNRFDSIQNEINKRGCSCIVLMPHAVAHYLKNNTPEL